jgi:hypothetical protein
MYTVDLDASFGFEVSLDLGPGTLSLSPPSGMKGVGKIDSSICPAGVSKRLPSGANVNLLKKFVANSSRYNFWFIDCVVNGMLVLGRIAGNGAGEGDRPARSPVVAVSKGELAAAEENDDRLDPGMFVGGFMFDSGVEGTGVLDDAACMGYGLSGSSDASVTTEPASDAVDALLPIDGRSALNEGGLELRISMFI